MKKSKLVGIIIGIFLFVCLIAGLTYAWFSWKGSDVVVEGSVACFNIDYLSLKEIGTNDNAIQLSMVNSYDESEYAEVSIALNSECTNIHGLATLYLNTNAEETDSDIFDGAFKYTVVKVDAVGNELATISNGVISSAEKIKLAENIKINSTNPSIYRIYVWINGVEAGNSYANLNYSGYISAEAVSSDELFKSYEEMTPQEKLEYDANLSADWFNTQRSNELNGEETDVAYSNWITASGGSFPTCPTSSEDDLKNCFTVYNEYNDIIKEGNITADVLEAVGLGGRGIQTSSYHSVSFINESTNKICVILKIDKSGGSYYETDYTTDFGNIRYRKSSGC